MDPKPGILRRDRRIDGMVFWRRSVEKSKIESIGYETIRETINVKKKIMQMINEKQLNIFGYVILKGRRDS